jgi:hypothetical protein
MFLGQKLQNIAQNHYFFNDFGAKIGLFTPKNGLKGHVKTAFKGVFWAFLG